jgi:endoglycosylceramidase
MTDASGRKLLLRGVNVMGAEYTPTSQPLNFDATDFAKIRAMGATVVRLPVAWANIEPTRGTYDPAALERARKIVADAGAAGLLVVLDMHQFHWSPCYGGNGMPAWATTPCPNINGGTANAAVETVPVTAFWADKALHSAFADAWAAVARAVGSPPWLLGYDIFNEPPVGLIPPAVFENGILAPFYRLVGSRLRAVDPGALIFVEPALSSFAHRFTMVNLGIERVVYAPHLYGNSFNDAAFHAGDFAGPTQFVPDLALGKQEAANIGAAYWAGEWGNLNPSEPVAFNVPQYAEDMLDAQDQLMVGSGYWTYYRGGGAWNPTVERILTRPSVFAVAGTPLSTTSDPNRLHLQWTSDGGTTRISLPANWTPTVTTTGPVTQAPTADPQWLDVTAPAGTTVAITVTGP